MAWGLRVVGRVDRREVGIEVLGGWESRPFAGRCIMEVGSPAGAAIVY